MDRRHQVFVSSTYKDLEAERQEIMYALLELDCMPAGMELFPATDANAWALIQSVIDDSDYYVLIIGGRYGSTGIDGMSFTEKEYEYAKETGKPVMAFLHGEPGKITADKTETTEDGKCKLAAFRKKVEEQYHVKYWTTAPELGGLVSRGLIHMKRLNPSDGWVPGRFAVNEATLLELEQLKAKVKELEAALVIEKNKFNVGAGLKDLASGEDSVTAAIAYHDENGKAQAINATTTWNNILKYVGPSLLNECDSEELKERIKLAFYHRLSEEKRSEIQFSQCVLTHLANDKIMLQLRALGYLTPGVKRRAVADKKSYWVLTPTGEQTLLQASAAKKIIAAIDQGEAQATSAKETDS